MRPPEQIRFSRHLRDVTVLRASGPAGQWEERLADAERAGYDRGVIDGEKALSEQLLRQRNELLELHNGAVQALRDAVPQVVQQTEEALIALAFEIAQKLVSALPHTRESVAATVREALSQIEGATEYTIQLHPEDLALLQGHASSIGALAGQEVRFTASEDVTRGGCLVQTRFGIVDARRETRLARIAENLGLAE